MNCEGYLINNFIPWEKLLEDLQYMPNEIKQHVHLILEILYASHKRERPHDEIFIENSLIKIETCIDRTWETLNSGYWKDVSIEYRYSYSLCSIVKVILLEISSKLKSNISKLEESALNLGIIQQIDKGILLGAPLPNSPQLLTDLASKINHLCDSKDTMPLDCKKIFADEKSINDALLPGFLPIHRYNEPSMEFFYKNIFLLKVPALIEGSIKHWKALQLWQNMEYLTKIAGNRTVPVEIGSRYTEDDWSQRLLTLSEFLKTYVLNKNDETGYLAQHQLFEQIPELKNDFTIPDYCSFSDNEDVDEEPDINAWFGPANTISPLHFDPKNNLLCQVFGLKRVILYPPEDTEYLYPYDTRLLDNTAQVDPGNPDYEKWPAFKKAKGIICLLNPGEILFIPPKWWHHVTSLTPSFSISFWWT
ncbi:bifunctional peptidase and arginyl-hydroxylase JMJD5 isoform X1 [Prorops nasuta]|uniref:bifunctional peptidase and arginyl-hydroxylase JMJD5 isoform X1 n=1 Tax=Prorops nasuta TaxID=863751 RepID=UPI0034CF28D4